MKFLVSLILIILLSFIAGIYFPWWSIALVAFLIAAFIPQKPLYSFLTGFVAIFVLWSFMAFYISFKNDDLLIHKISMIILKIDSAAAMVVVTGLIGALVAGFAALAASYLRKAV